MALLNQILAWLADLHSPWPYLIVFAVLLLCGFGLPMPEDIMLFAGGMMAYYGRADIYVMTIIAFAGIMIGDTTIFLLGNRFGPALLKHRLFSKILHEERLAYVREQYHKHGNKVIFAARFMPGLRTPVFFTSGTLHLPFRIFFFYDGLAALISVPLITFSVYTFGHQVEKVVNTVRQIENGIVIVIVVVIVLVAAKVWWSRRAARKAEAARQAEEATGQEAGS